MFFLFLQVLSLCAADITTDALLEIIWGSRKIPSPQQFQEFRQQFPQSFLTPQQALAKITSIAQDALNEYPEDIHLLSPYMQNLEQVCLDVAEILPEIAQMERNDDFAFLQKEYQESLFFPNFAYIFGIHMVLHTTDMFFLYKAFLEHPQKDQINQTLTKFGHTSNLPLLNIQSKEGLKKFLLTIERKTIQKNSQIILKDKSICPPSQFDVLAGMLNESAPSTIDLHMHKFVQYCSIAHHSHLSTLYIFTDSGLFSMISDPVATENRAHLISLPTKISSTSYSVRTHQTASGLASCHIHDYTHFAGRQSFWTAFDMMFEPAIPSQEQASSLFAKKFVDYIEDVILTQTNKPLALHIFKMLYMFSTGHETRGIPTLTCSVQQSLQKICSHWRPSDPDLAGLIAFTEKQIQESNPEFTLAQAWGCEGKELAEYLAPTFKFKTSSKRSVLSSSDVFNALPDSVLRSWHSYSCVEPLDLITCARATQSPNPFTHNQHAGALETSFSSLGTPPNPSLEANFHITVPEAKNTHKNDAFSLTNFFQQQYDTRPTPETQSLLQKALDMNVPFAFPYGAVRTFNQKIKCDHPVLQCSDTLTDEEEISCQSDSNKASEYYRLAHKKNHAFFIVRKRVTPQPFTVYFEKSTTPFSYAMPDAAHGTLVLSTPSLSQIGGIMHQEFLEALAHILTEDLREYCCFQQCYQVQSARFAYSFHYNMFYISWVSRTCNTYCTSPLYKNLFLNLSCSCPKLALRHANKCTGGSLFA